MRDNKNTKDSSDFRLDLLTKASESVLEMADRCAHESDPDIQLKQAQAVSLLTEALARFNFKIER